MLNKDKMNFSFQRNAMKQLSSHYSPLQRAMPAFAFWSIESLKS
jgi:hypothetical protein